MVCSFVYFLCPLENWPQRILKIRSQLLLSFSSFLSFSFYCSSWKRIQQTLLAAEKSKGMGEHEEGMDLADEVDVGGKVMNKSPVSVSPIASPAFPLADVPARLPHLSGWLGSSLADVTLLTSM